VIATIADAVPFACLTGIVFLAWGLTSYLIGRDQ
jgi:hypothetical protein